MSWFMNCTGLEQLAIVATVLLFSVLIAEIFDCAKVFSCRSVSQLIYGYENYRGPITCKRSLPSSWGKFQSPINLLTRNAICVPVETVKPIRFSAKYYDLPSSVVAMNDGHTLIVYGYWNSNSNPKLSGGPLTGTYRFECLRFRWGPNDEEGSEHTIDGKRYTMEVQAIHVKNKEKYSYLGEAVADKSVLILSYLFEMIPIDNPHLDPLLINLKYVRKPYTHCTIQPFPFSWLILPFNSKYYFYTGSLTFPPCAEGVDWLIQAETMSVSSRQMQKFRNLCSLDGGPIETNTRPAQDLNGRALYFYD